MRLPRPHHLRLAAALGEVPAPDPVLREPTGPRHVEVALARATAATRHADVCWSELTRAVERNLGTEEARAELLAALAQQVYAWAVYHSTVMDADQPVARAGAAGAGPGRLSQPSP